MRIAILVLLFCVFALSGCNKREEQKEAEQHGHRVSHPPAESTIVRNAHSDPGSSEPSAATVRESRKLIDSIHVLGAINTH